jgi:hypothetical protein
MSALTASHCIPWNKHRSLLSVLVPAVYRLDTRTRFGEFSYLNYIEFKNNFPKMSRYTLKTQTEERKRNSSTHYRSNRGLNVESRIVFSLNEKAINKAFEKAIKSNPKLDAAGKKS